MSHHSSESSNDERSDHQLSIDNCEDYSSAEEEEELSEVDRDLCEAVCTRNDAAAVQHALRNGANVSCVCSEDYDASVLDEIIRVILDANAEDVPFRNDQWTPLQDALGRGGFDIAHLLLDRGANALATTQNGMTTLMLACRHRSDLEIIRRLLASGVSLEACDEIRRTALHYAAERSNSEVLRELLVKHNANMFAMDKDGNTPFDLVTRTYLAGERYAFLIETYANKLTQEHGQLALHAVLGTAEYLCAEDDEFFHPPLNPLRIRLPLGDLTLQHFRSLLHSLDTESVSNQDEAGKLPIHIACRNKAPVEVLALMLEHAAAMLHMTDDTGALPIHECCSGTLTEYTSVQYLVEQGGVRTLAAPKRNGALPLHALCGSTNPPLRAVQYLIHSFPKSVAARTNAGHYPFMIAACESSTASLSVVYELVRTKPNLVIPH